MNFGIVTILIAIAFALASCEGTDQLPPASAKVRFQVSGRIVAPSGASVVGIPVYIDTLWTVTDKNGRYAIPNLPNGLYKVVPQSEKFTFIPSEIQININGRDVGDINFTAEDFLKSDMKLIAGGSFVMGSSNQDLEEYPPHNVTVKTFAVGKYEVTQKQWREIMGYNPSAFVGDSLPVERISWYDALSFCNALSMQEGLDPVYLINDSNTACNFDANGYRLLTEAEWEYACRGGTTTDYYSGNQSVSLKTCYHELVLDNVGWYCNNSNESTQPVGRKSPNSFGLYDMHGNVFEWCWDRVGRYSSSPQVNPVGPNAGSARVCRGGSWFYVPQQSRSSYRLAYSPMSKFSGVGFRIARTIQ